MCSNCSGDYESPGVMGAERDELSNEEMLSHGKCEIIGPSERVAQIVASAVASFYHTNLVAQIHERMGEGDPLHLALRDTYYREKFRMAARKL